MMIVLTQHDIAQLSPQCRDELQRVLFGRTSEPEGQQEEPFIFDGPPDDYLATVNDDQVEALRERKRVIDITREDAASLIANISARSLQTLACFTTGKTIALDDLIGPEGPYENLTDFKRSFVGAVTRRLRTVTRNKQATLFLRTSITDASGNERSAIAVRPDSAESLRLAMNLSSQQMKE
jgi:hypothetical protein